MVKKSILRYIVFVDENRAKSPFMRTELVMMVLAVLLALYRTALDAVYNAVPTAESAAILLLWSGVLYLYVRKLTADSIIGMLLLTLLWLFSLMTPSTIVIKFDVSFEVSVLFVSFSLDLLALPYIALIVYQLWNAGVFGMRKSGALIPEVNENKGM